MLENRKSAPSNRPRVNLNDFNYSFDAMTRELLTQPTPSVLATNTMLNTFDSMVRQLAKSNSVASAALLDLQAASLRAQKSLSASIASHLQEKYMLYLNHWFNVLFNIPQLGDTAITVRYHDMCSMLFKESSGLLDDAGRYIAGFQTVMVQVAAKVADILEDLQYLRSAGMGRLHSGPTSHRAIGDAMKELEKVLFTCQTLFEDSE